MKQRQERIEMPEDYLLDEVRCGYYIPPMMKKAWACELKVLGEVDRICKKYDIFYFADWGTMLGAVRHGGIIPWDDDVDICMKREDYRRFCEIALGELPDGYVLENIHTNPDFDLFLARVTGNQHLCFDEAYLNEFYGFPYRSGIDIFVLDYVDPDALRQKERSACCLRLIACGDMLYQEHDVKTKRGNHELSSKSERIICEAEKTGRFRMDRGKPLRQQIYIRVEEMFASVEEEKADEIIQMFPLGLKGGRGIRKDFYADAVRLPFEYMEIPVLTSYDVMLRNRYGDYMNYSRVYGAHNYPFYEAQKREFEEKVGVAVPDFFDPVMSFSERCMEKRVTVSSEKHTSEDANGSVIVFLPYRGRYWGSLKPYYEEAISDEKNTVYVVPLPYFEKGIADEITREVFELSEYPENLELYDYRQVDLKALHPDVIYIQNPYDAFHASVTVPREYYAEGIRKYTEKLIYVPYFQLKDFASELSNEKFCMRHYCTVPGVIFADEVILSSEEMKKRYLEKLREFSGGKELPCMVNLRVETRKEPDALQTKRKKCFLYRNTVSSFREYGMANVKKIEAVLRQFYDYREQVRFVWSPQAQLSEYQNWMEQDAWQAYQELVDRYKQEQWGDYVEESRIERDIEGFDAYYGDPGELATRFAEAGKPVMLQAVDLV